MKRSVIIPTGREKDILADVTYNEGVTPKGIAIFCHGYKGYKDWGAWNLVADEFANNGITFLKFNFSHNGGTMENPIDFPDLEAFGKNTLSLEVKDLESVLKWVNQKNDFSDYMNLSDITIIGHSRGGGIVTLVGQKEVSVKQIVSWAGVSNFSRWFPENEKLIARWKSNGVSYVLNGRTKQQMPHYFSFFEDFHQNKKQLNILDAASKITTPHLIIHGDADEAVKVDEAYQLAERNPDAVLSVVQGGDHTLGSKHPWNENTLPDSLKEVVDKTIKFINSSNKM